MSSDDSSEEAVESGRSCTSAPVVTGATLVWVRGPLTTVGVSEGAELEYQCNDNLRDTEAPCEPSKIRCINGKWHGRLPKCGMLFSNFIETPPKSINRPKNRQKSPTPREI